MSSETFSYKGISAGKYVEGTIDALSQEEASFKLKDQKISYDVFKSMASSILDAEKIGKFRSIKENDIFKMEYWPLERAKLNSAKPQSLEGNNVIITGGGGTIGTVSYTHLTLPTNREV